MAVQTVTDPMLLDSTGLGMIEAMNGIANAVQPVNIYVDVEISIPVDAWSESVPHRYTWMSNRVTTECGVEVSFKNGAENVAMDYLYYEKVIGGIQFEINDIPDAAVPLVVRIINAEADTIIDPTGADQVTTSAVPGTSNVEEALANHERRIVSNTSTISDIEDDIADINTELDKRVQTLNGIAPDEYGNIDFDEVEFARQLVTDDAQQSTGEFLFRTTGGDASLTDGDAKLVSISGRSIHTGVVEEVLNMTVTMATREPEQAMIEAVLDRDAFLEEVTESATITLSFTNAWSEDPADYGITVTGTPITGDQIVVVYVKADRGLITNSNPNKFTSTGWNLYNHTLGYAHVKKYSDQYGFLIGGAYSGIQFSETLDGEKQTLTPASGYFTIPADGYIWVSNGDSTTTYILMTWSDWGEGYEGDWKAYEESSVNLTTIMTNFPYGLMQVGAYSDEINFSMKRAISRIERLAYTEENLADVIAAGRQYDADEDYIYAVKLQDDIYVISATGNYTACDHGNEIVDGGTVDVYVQTLYGRNLVDYLRRDIPDAISGINDHLQNLTLYQAWSARTRTQFINSIAKDLFTVLKSTGEHRAIIHGYCTMTDTWATEYYIGLLKYISDTDCCGFVEVDNRMYTFRNTNGTVTYNEFASSQNNAYVVFNTAVVELTQPNQARTYYLYLSKEVPFTECMVSGGVGAAQPFAVICRPSTNQKWMITVKNLGDGQDAGSLYVSFVSRDKDVTITSISDS